MSTSLRYVGSDHQTEEARLSASWHNAWRDHQAQAMGLTLQGIVSLALIRVVLALGYPFSTADLQTEVRLPS